MELVVGGQTLRIPLRISHDGQGRIYTHLWDPYPVTIDLTYTSYTITYHYVDIGQAGSNINLTPNAGEDVLRVGLVESARTALTTGTPTIFVRYNEPNTGRVVEHLVSSVSTPTGTNQVNGQYGFQFVDLTLDGRTLTGAVQPPTNTDVTILIDGVTPPTTPTFSVGIDGLVDGPTQTNVNNGNFLRADNTWQPIVGDVNFNAAETTAIRVVNNRFEFVINNTTVAVLDANGMRAVDFVNDPTPAN